MQGIFGYIDDHADVFVANLKEALEIPSVSASKAMRWEVKRMIEWAGNRLENLGATVEYADIGSQTFPDNESVPLPPVILASFISGANKPMVLIYGHLDVQPADISDGWDSEPFTLVERDGVMYGRGSTDDKGPVLGWFNAIEAILKTEKELPVNLKFCLEGMEESGSEGLEELLISRTDSFLKDIDYVVISDNYWLDREHPCLTYSLRGIAYFNIEVTCAKQDLHSGMYGGQVPEAMTDLVHLMSSLLDHKGRILIPGIYDAVRTLTEGEDKLYDAIEFDLNAHTKNIGCNKLLHTHKNKVLQSTWREPSISLHGIEGAFSESGSKTVIPRKVVGKFSIRLVSNMDLNVVANQVTTYLEKRHEASGSVNSMVVTMSHGGRPWSTDPLNDTNFCAATAATEMVWGVKPYLTAEGGSIPITVVLQDTTNAKVLLLPMGQSDDGAHSQNEKLRRLNYIQGSKVMAAYFFELAKLHGLMHAAG